MTLQRLAYTPSIEQPEPNEARTTASINKSMRGILETTWQDYGHSVRGAHAKSHGLLQGELRVLDGLPKELAQGMFARPGTYPVVLRISTNPGGILDDTVSSPRGFAMKVIGIQGERLPGSFERVRPGAAEGTTFPHQAGRSTWSRPPHWPRHRHHVRTRSVPATGATATA